MIFGLGTSVVVRLLAGEPRDLAFAALRFVLERQEARDRLRISDLVLAEAYYALQHHYGAPKGETLAALRALVESPGFDAGEAPDILATSGLESAKPGFVDRLIHGVYLRSGAERVVTFETATAKLPEVLVLSA